ncbi:alpha-amylase family glycosyl hydrolase [Gracilimonas tropica]|uniref:alpha-amylase family glycosyl hydrolase n=1 Tax=Gracilimonas tropica TaxID=454600 RepID=UPI0003613781|nr:alpha-amylase family glycosyl hydrolase [Gracilimonas tropica]
MKDCKNVLGYGVWGVLRYFLRTLVGFSGIVLLLTAGVQAQISTDPAFPEEGSSVTIYFNAAEGSAGLKGFSGEVYAHTGVITDESAKGDLSDWKYVIAEWDENIPKAKLTRIGSDLYSLTIPEIREYYGVPSGEEILKLAMVFRSADGELEGKGENDTDLFIDIYDEGVHVRFQKPREKTTILNLNGSLDVEVVGAAIGSGFQNMKLYENGIEVAESNSTSLSYTVSASSTGLTEMLAVSSNSLGVSDSAYAYYLVPDEVVDMPRPGGVQEGIYYDESDPTKVTLSLLAPYKSRVYVIGEFNDWQVRPEYQMKRDVRGNQEVYWWLEINGLTPEKEYAFQYLVDEKIRIADPYSEKVLHPDDSWIQPEVYPDLKPYPNGKTTEYVSIIQTNKPDFNWTDDGWERPDPNNLVIYELLVRDFSESHDFATVIDSLDYLQRLGINAIELLPVNEFEGNSSWGYNPSFYLAPDRYYGPEDDLKRLVNEAHKRGIAVILDAVYNHSFGQSPMVRLYNEGNYGQPTPQNIWFNSTARHPFNVGYDFNHESIYTQRFIDRVNKYWLEEYRIDGFRYDLSKGFTQNYSGDVGAWNQYDQSRIDLLLRMKNKIREYDQSAYLILEHLGNNDEEKVLADNGFMLWGIMHDPFKEAAMGYDGDLTGTSYQSRGWNEPHLVGYMESHDEERIMYELSNYGNSVGGYDTKNEETALNRMKLAHAFLLAVPGPKMIWQFGELGYDVSISVNGRTGEKPILWEYRRDTDRYRLYRTMRELIKLKTTEPAFKTTDFALDVGGKQKKILLRSSNDVQLIGNFDVVDANVQPFTHNSGSGKWWYEYFSGDSLQINESSPPSVNLAPGEFRLYSTQKIGPAPSGLLNETLPSISLSSTSIKFEEIQGENTPPYQKSLTITNSGSAPLNITDISGFSSVFTVSPTGGTIAPGEALKLSITFDPPTVGSYNDTFTIKSLQVSDKTFSVEGELLSSVPLKPTLLLPQNQSEGVAIKTALKWTEVSTADAYELEIRSGGELIKVENNYTSTSYRDAEFKFQTSYSWRVRAVNSFGKSEWTEPFTFTTTPDIPGKIKLTAPDSAAEGVSTSPELNWIKDKYTEEYQVAVAEEEQFENIVYSDSDLQETAVQVVGLNADKKYYWRIRGSNKVGTGSWSEAWSFRTSAIGTPELHYPEIGQVNIPTDTTLIWRISTNADSYRIQISKKPDFSTQAEQNGITDTSYTPGFLERNTTYYWRVKSASTDFESDWSAKGVFSTVFDEPSIPAPVAPDNGAINIPDELTIKWTKVDLATSYRLQISDDQSFEKVKIDTANIQGTFFEVVELLSRNTTYYWRVKSVNPSEESEWSVVQSFNTLPVAPNAPLLASPSDSLTDTQIDLTFHWRSSGEETKYRFQLAENSSFTQKFDTSGVSDTLLVITSLKNNQTYYWRVSAVNTGGNSKWSDVNVFKTVISKPEPVILVQPLKGDLVHPLENRFVWVKAERASTYRFQLSADATFETPLVDTVNITDQKLENINLEKETRYYWRVQGANRGGAGNWSEVQEIETKFITSIEETGVPREFTLMQNYPNPFNPTTSIMFGLPHGSEVLLEVFTITGQKVATLVKKYESAGYHTVQFDAESLSSGLYLYRIKAGDYVQVRKLTLIK